MAAMHRRLEKRLAKAVAFQAKYYNSKHIAREYNVGDLIYLNSKNIDSTRLTKKLDQKFYGPYTVINRIGKVAYRLDLPASIKIHNVFYVSLLKLCDQSKSSILPLPPIIVDSEKEFEVEKVLDSRTHYGKLQYLIKWLGYPDTDNQWVSEEQVFSSKDLVELFYKLYPHKPRVSKKKS